MKRLLKLLSLALLFALCVGATELAAARFADPALYDSVITAIQSGAHNMRAQLEKWAAEEEARREEARERKRQEAERRRLEEEERQRQEAERRQKAEDKLHELDVQMASPPAIREKPAVADPAVTELISEDGQEVLTGGSVRLVYYNQGDPLWAEQRYGSDPIGGYGCGPTALAMAVASLTDAAADPASLAAWAARSGYCARHSGSYLSIVEGTAAHFGLDCESLGAADPETLYARLSEGGIAVALMGPGHFTARGHFILLHGVTLSGGILVADPNSRENSLTVWDPQVITEELSRSRHDGAPLWLLTVPETL